MKNTFRNQIGLMRFLWRSVVTKPFGLTVNGHTCPPFVLIPDDTHKTGFVPFVWFANVLGISFRAYITQVLKSVIRFVAVNVINQSNRPTIVKIEPRKPMCFIDTTPNANCSVSFFVNYTRSIASFNSAAGTYGPRKCASFRVVLKYLLQFFCGNIRLAHTSSPMLSFNVNTGITK